MPKIKTPARRSIIESFAIGQSVRQLSASYKQTPSEIEDILRSHVRKLETEIKDMCGL